MSRPTTSLKRRRNVWLLNRMVARQNSLNQLSNLQKANFTCKKEFHSLLISPHQSTWIRPSTSPGLDRQPEAREAFQLEVLKTESTNLGPTQFTYEPGLLTVQTKWIS